MPDWLLPLLGVAVTASLGVLTWTSTRRSGDRDTITRLQKRNDSVEARNKNMDDYVVDLRQHIIEGKGTTPPPYPASLKREESNQ